MIGLFVSIIVAILGFGLLVVIHESGHFLTARCFGIQADEFAVGMGPRIASVKRGKTRYALRAIPVGAFVMFADPEDDEEATAVNNDYLNAAAYKRGFISLAGPLFNFIFAALIFTLIAFFSGVASNQPVIAALLPGGAAEAAGMQIGDRLLSVDGKEVKLWSDVTALISPSGDKSILVEIERDGERLQFNLKPVLNSEGRGVIGISSGLEKFAVWKSLQAGVTSTLTFITETLAAFTQIFSRDGLNSLVGPIGIVSVTGQVAQTGFTNLVWFLAYLSINLGIVNLLPLPALDGGKTMIVLLEMIRGKKISAKLESRISIVGFVLIFSLIIFVSFRDIINLRG
ncbi:MAG: RIP metalloprotease RseP [Negativicutes bacterium]|nr:RIP metalloprotease RseP [Negativicutes bacterium]